MKEEKYIKVLDAATRVFGERGYHHATISDIVSRSGFSTGLVYAYFVNKLDILLSIVLDFFKQINHLNDETLKSMKDPLEKLTAVLHNFEQLYNKGDNLYLIKILNEAFPIVNDTSGDKLKGKRQEIREQNRKLMKTIDDIIIEGQNSGIFDGRFNPCAVRQIFSGSMRVLMNGLCYQKYSYEKMGFESSDVHTALMGLIQKYIRA